MAKRSKKKQTCSNNKAKITKKHKKKHKKKLFKDPKRKDVGKALAKALCKLANLDPNLSAAKPAGRLLGSVIIVLCALGALGVFIGLDLTALSWWVIGSSATLGFFRLWACGVPPRPLLPIQTCSTVGSEPVWTVLVALYQEANSVEFLLLALSRLQWPRKKLDLVFACEADDHETLAALKVARARVALRIVLVPPGGPRTKPKALQTSLPFCKGRYLSIYDAEDIPAPLQLYEAWQAFREGPEMLAVVQAPLVAWNEHESWITRQFALDYALWFRIVLPALAHFSPLLPLGGTSNHFDIDRLRAVGGWDPFNVTEDADLGIRLARAGFSAGLIHSPTYEEGTPTLRGWVRQRGRWIQGHLQTISVHLRAPFRLAQDLGVRGLLSFFLGLMSGPLHAAVSCTTILLVIAQLANGLWDSVLVWALLMVLSQCIVSLVAVYRDGRKNLLLACLTFPFYQGCQVLALCRALWRIYLSPSIWDKTKHGADARPAKHSFLRDQAAISEPKTWIGDQL